MTFRILVTNDDGITAPGLKVAEEIATELAGKNGLVITVAPAVDQSGVSHSVSYLRPSLIHKHSNNRYSIEGSPADCVLAGIYYVMKEHPPNLIISGVNKGHNVSDDIVYSGTVGAAMEGSLQEIQSISISQCYSKESLLFENTFEASSKFGANICKQLLQLNNWDCEPYHTFFNVNFPAVRVSDVKGVAICKQDKRPKGSFSMDAIESPSGRTFLMVNHKPGTKKKGVKADKYESDSRSVKNNYITVTPLKADLTSYTELADLENVLNNDF